MRLKQLSLAPESVDGRQPSADDGPKIPRLPRWSRQEILVLIQGKKVAENRVKRGQAEPKWASVASYCKRHGVNRGPVQCRKRWSNLAGDFKKIKEWESKGADQSFWLMRNDLRRERKLPGFFDKEVYDILDGGLSLEEEEEEEVALFDSGRSAVADEGLFSDEPPDQSKEAASIPSPVSVAKKLRDSPVHCVQGTTNEKRPASDAEIRSSDEGCKRKRIATDEDGEVTAVEFQLIEALEKNGKMLGLQLEAQNIHLQLEREQRKEHVNGLITVLNKLADALGRIADKL